MNYPERRNSKVVAVVLLALGIVKANDIPTYEHPTIAGQRCYQCPPGFRISSINIDARECPKTADNSPSYPDCVQCPDGYYSETWNTLHYCKEQNLCQEPGQYIIYEGSYYQPNICGCMYGIKEDFSCKTLEEMSKIDIKCPQTPVKCPEVTMAAPTPCPTVSCTVPTAKPCSNTATVSTETPQFHLETLYYVLMVLLCLLSALAGFCCSRAQDCQQKKQFSTVDTESDKGTTNAKPPTTSEKDLDNACRYVEEHVTDALKLMRDGLLLETHKIESLEDQYKGRNLKMKALDLWKQRQENPTVNDLIKALTECGMNLIANHLREEFLSKEKGVSHNLSDAYVNLSECSNLYSV